MMTMNVAKIKNRAADIAAKTFSILYVAVLRAADGLRWLWENRRTVFPKVLKYAAVLLAGVLLALLFTHKREPAPQSLYSPGAALTATETPVVEEVVERSPEEEAAAMAAQEQEIREAAIRNEASAMAKVLYGVARYHSADAQAAVCWLIINRVESPAYPNTVEEVCTQAKQWVGYSNENPVIRDLLDVATGVLEEWHSENGVRPFGKDYLFMTWTGSEIILRTTFEERQGTRYYHVS